MSPLVGHLFERSYIGKTELLMQLDGCDVVRHDKRQQRMNLFSLTRMLNNCLEQACSHPFSVGRGIHINRGLIAP